MNASATSVNGHRERRGTAPIAVDAKRLPHNRNAEASILGGIILRNDVLLELEHLEPDDFYDHRHKIIFQAIRNLESRHKPIDVVTLENEIERAEKLEAVGGIAYLGELALSVPTADNVVAYAGEVRTYAKNRRAIIALHDALERAYSWAGDERDELITETARELQRIEDLHGRDRAHRLQWTTPIADYLGDVEPDDDDSEEWLLRDLVPRCEPWLLGGPAKAGKTWLTLALMVALALGEDFCGAKNTRGKPARSVGIFREDGARRLSKRLWEVCRAFGVEPTDPRIANNIRISREPLYLPDHKLERKLIAELRAFEADCLFGDNFTRILVGASNDEEDVKALARPWGEIVDATGVSFCLLHHLRKGSGSANKGDVFEAFRGAGDILGFARHAVAVEPRRDDNEKLSEIRMRGNLDLRRDSFVIGFERIIKLGKWSARFEYRGDITEVAEERQVAKKEANDSLKRQALLEKQRADDEQILEAARKNRGTIAATAAGPLLGVSARAPRVVDAFARLTTPPARLVRLTGPEKNLGYRLIDAVQKDIPL